MARRKDGFLQQQQQWRAAGKDENSAAKNAHVIDLCDSDDSDAEQGPARQPLKPLPAMDMCLSARRRAAAMRSASGSPFLDCRNGISPAVKERKASKQGQATPAPPAEAAQPAAMGGATAPTHEDRKEEEFEPLFEYGSLQSPAARLHETVELNDSDDDDVNPTSLWSMGRKRKAQEPLKQEMGNFVWDDRSCGNSSTDKQSSGNVVLETFAEPPAVKVSAKMVALIEKRRRREAAAAIDAAAAEAIISRAEEEARAAAMEKDRAEGVGQSTHSDGTMKESATSSSMNKEDSEHSAEPPEASGSQKHEGEKIRLKLRTKGNEDHCYKLGKTDPLEKLFQAFAKKVSGSIGDFIFLFDGEKLAPTQTPTDFDMDDDDMIEVVTRG